MGAAQSGNGDRGQHLDLFESKGLYPVSLLDTSIPNLAELSNLTSPPAQLGGYAD